MTPGDRDREMAREFWRWFRHAPLAECRDSACDVKLAEQFATARAEGRAEAVAEIVAWLRTYADSDDDEPHPMYEVLGVCDLPVTSYDAIATAECIEHCFGAPRSAAAEKTSESWRSPRAAATAQDTTSQPGGGSEEPGACSACGGRGTIGIQHPLKPAGVCIQERPCDECHGTGVRGGR